MSYIATFVSALRRNKEGQELLEYGLLVGLVALVAFGAIRAIALILLD